MSNQRNIYIINRQRLAGMELQQQLEGMGFMVFRPISLIDTGVVLAKIVPDLVIADSDVRSMPNFLAIKRYFVKYKIPVICIEDHFEDVPEECEGINVIAEMANPFDSSEVVRMVRRYFRNLAGAIILLTYF